MSDDNVNAPLRTIAGIKVAVRSFDSPAALADRAEAVSGKSGLRDFTTGFDRWYGRHDWNGSLTAMRRGDDRIVPLAETMREALESALGDFNTRKVETQNHYVGALPNVAAALAGSPLNMRRRVRIESDMAPLTIVADLCASCTISADDLVKRGAALLAAVQIISAKRPVSIYTVSGSRHNNMTAVAITRIESMPFHLATAAFAIAEPAGFRRLNLAVLQTIRDDISVIGSHPFVERQEKTIPAIVSDVLGVPLADIAYLPPARGLSISDPVTWARGVIEQYGRPASDD